MKEKMQRYIYAALALLLGLLCIWGLFVYAAPMKNVTLDLSLISQEDALVSDHDDFDSKGWTVYTREGDAVTELTPNGFGGYTGLALGQTFYLSRTLEEELDSPTLQLDPIEYRFSIWLDEELIYTDCPELDNRIGYVQLPMNEWFRENPIVITLPTDYQGKTLTIAQSFPVWTETGSVTAWPASVKLYCSYAYESSLISETFRTAVLACLAFLIAAVLLVSFVRSRNWSILCMALVAALRMAQQLVSTSFFTKYFRVFENSPTAALPLLSTLVLLIFLTLRGGTRRKLLWGLVGLSALSTIVALVLLTVYPVIPVGDLFLSLAAHVVPYWLSFLTLLTVLVLGSLFWRKENWFYRVFTPMVLVAIVLTGVWNVAVYGVVFWEQIVISLSSGQIDVFYRFLPAVTIAALVTTAAQSVRDDLNRRAEQHLMEQRRELAQESYENLRRQHEEVMMLRHDMLRHFHTLHDMGDEEKRTEYLAELIGKNEKIRPVVESGNEMLDIILNGRLSAAIDAGISVELPHIAAPAKLPVSDPDLCALFLNLVDNAITAASAAQTPRLLLKLHPKDGQLAIVCENSFDPEQTESEAKKETVPKHGLGLKIAYNIVEKYKGAMITESREDQFSVKIVIPLG